MSESSEKPEDQVERPVAADSSAPAKQDGRVTKGQLARDVAIYSIARLLLVVVIGAIILGVAALVGVAVPLLVAAIFAVLIALPLSLLLFAKLRRRVNEGIAAFDAQRRADQADLRARLRGEGTSR
ncbi:hypothetical protein OPAG_00581 [Rhodococcus opacus PD630]|uniref:DUF4229 domain-containing protein n=1 Tax=Rhodococcus TaxID=1827 RepID=UPI00029CBBAF|nr:MULTISPECIES: DUF4229 domain-containing protein [Rhodococcus]KXF49575.1 hypothetical protein AXA44_24075 [Rhodococcus sp. SC4]RZK83516.1 MAG: DUF4229 domain-containing protein [Rhodococcus sp. (in: high G+C Gram-positive bacteria)]AHK33390.1 hypothetical protein Pd630_LPD06203 [Rhodococcus opacus PD630]EHI40672.1 hypothetical protein OPAG_00581 [Rhodococcus opacus PD630]KXX62801.1 hypothetical protein AZG88_03590 [Rhodococcus sp. LB1]